MNMMNIGRLLAWALVLAMPLWFGSCKHGDGGGPVTPNSIEGSWKISGLKINNGKETEDILEFLKNQGQEGADIVACLTDTKLVFASGGKITGTPSPYCKSDDADAYNPVANSATWSVSGNKVTLTDSDGSTDVYDLTITNSTMTWVIQKLEDLDGDGVKENVTATLAFKRA